MNPILFGIHIEMTVGIVMSFRIELPKAGSMRNLKILQIH